MFDGSGKNRFGSFLIDGEIVPGAASERHSGDVINGVDLIEGFVPIGLFIKPAVYEIDLRVLEVFQFACSAHEASYVAASFDEVIDEMAPDETGCTGHQDFSRIARFAHDYSFPPYRPRAMIAE